MCIVNGHPLSVYLGCLLLLSLLLGLRLVLPPMLWPYILVVLLVSKLINDLTIPTLWGGLLILPPLSLSLFHIHWGYGGSVDTKPLGMTRGEE